MAMVHKRDTGIGALTQSIYQCKISNFTKPFRIFGSNKKNNDLFHISIHSAVLIHNVFSLLCHSLNSSTFYPLIANQSPITLPIVLSVLVLIASIFKLLATDFVHNRQQRWFTMDLGQA